MEEFLGDDVGRALRRRGWAWMWGGVPLGGGGWVREAVRGRAWQRAQGWREAAALGPTWTHANSAITPHSEQLAHNGYSGTCSLSIGHGDPRSSPLACLSTTRQPEITPSRCCRGCRRTHTSR